MRRKSLAERDKRLPNWQREAIKDAVRHEIEQWVVNQTFTGRVGNTDWSLEIGNFRLELMDWEITIDYV